MTGAKKLVMKPKSQNFSDWQQSKIFTASSEIDPNDIAPVTTKRWDDGVSEMDSWLAASGSDVTISLAGSTGSGRPGGKLLAPKVISKAQHVKCQQPKLMVITLFISSRLYRF